MNILVLASKEREAEFSLKFPKRPYIFIHTYTELPAWLGQADVVFDFLLPENPEKISLYQKQNKPELIVFCNAVRLQLAALAKQAGGISFHLFGFNGLPGFLNRSLLEVSALRPESTNALQKALKWMDTEFELVEDRVGMVSPRIICMIINEAFYTLQEKTASKQDIDLGMKLGTNYPNGPFEWADKIGIKNVYDVLNALYLDNREERYKICPLLKTEYLRTELAVIED